MLQATLFGVFALSGVVLLLGGAILVRQRASRERDPVALGRVLLAVGVALLVGALLLRPHDPRTSAFRSPPDLRGASR